MLLYAVLFPHFMFLGIRSANLTHSGTKTHYCCLTSESKLREALQTKKRGNFGLGPKWKHLFKTS